jgi:hypothetical protein
LKYHVGKKGGKIHILNFEGEIGSMGKFDTAYEYLYDLM